MKSQYQVEILYSSPERLTNILNLTYQFVPEKENCLTLCEDITKTQTSPLIAYIFRRYSIAESFKKSVEELIIKENLKIKINLKPINLNKVY